MAIITITPAFVSTIHKNEPVDYLVVYFGVPYDTVLVQYYDKLETPKSKIYILI